MKKVKLKWDKKENDWVGDYPTRNGKILLNSLFSMIRDFEKTMQTNLKGEPTDFTTFRDYLEKGGFDPDSFTISVKLKYNPNHENKTLI